MRSLVINPFETTYSERSREYRTSRWHCTSRQRQQKNYTLLFEHHFKHTRTSSPLVIRFTWTMLTRKTSSFSTGSTLVDVADTEADHAEDTMAEAASAADFAATTVATVVAIAAEAAMVTATVATEEAASARNDVTFAAKKDVGFRG
jgi:hypothetical protein